MSDDAKAPASPPPPAEESDDYRRREAEVRAEAAKRFCPLCGHRPHGKKRCGATWRSKQVDLSVKCGCDGKPKPAPPPPSPPARDPCSVWHREETMALRRWRSEKAVRGYASRKREEALRDAQEASDRFDSAETAAEREDAWKHADRRRAEAASWGEIRMRHVPEILRNVPGALWSVTVRDLIAEAESLCKRSTLMYSVSGSDHEKRQQDRHVTNVLINTAYPGKLPKSLRGHAIPDPAQAEAAETRKALAEYFAAPHPPSVGIARLDAMAKREAREMGRTLTDVRADLAETLGVEPETIHKAKQRARNPETVREAGRRARARRRAIRRH